MLSNERIEEIRQRDGNTNTPMTTVEEERRELLGHMSAQQARIDALTEQLKAADVETRNDFDLYLQEKVGLVETIRTLTEELHETRIERNIIFNLDMEHQARIEQQEITIRTMTRLVSKFMQTDEAEAISEIHPGQGVIRFMPRSPRRDEPV